MRDSRGPVSHGYERAGLVLGRPTEVETDGRVLIVEDDPGLLLLLKEALSRAGYSTALAADCDRGRDHLNAGDIDAVVIDSHMAAGEAWRVVDEVCARAWACWVSACCTT